MLYERKITCELGSKCENRNLDVFIASCIVYIMFLMIGLRKYHIVTKTQKRQILITFFAASFDARR
jgi:hypothetical protein